METTETALNVTLLEMIDDVGDNSNDTINKYFLLQSTNPNLTECRPTILKSELTVRTTYSFWFFGLDRSDNSDLKFYYTIVTTLLKIESTSY